MSKSQILCLLILTFILASRIWQTGGLNSKYVDPELESLSRTLNPLNVYLGSTPHEILPQPQAALLSGMVLGIKSELSPDFQKALRNTSTIHVVVVSGQNLTLLSGFIMNLAPFFGRKKTLVLSILVNIFYSLLTGLQIPVIRAAVMASMGALASISGREGNSGWILVLTALVMLIYNPNWLLSVSFQLSFLATLGVVMLAPELVKVLKKLPELGKEDLAVSFSAQILTMPVIAANFHQVSLVGVLVNSLVLWTVSPVMITGILALIVGIFNNYIGQFFAIIPGIFLTFFVYIIGFFDGKWASLQVVKVSEFFWLGYYFLVASLYFFLKKINSKYPVT